MKRKHVIFDFFGTLVDYTPSIDGKSFKESYKLALKQGFTGKYEEFLTSWKSSFIDLIKKYDDSLEEVHMHMIVMNFYRRHIPNHLLSIQEFLDTYLEEWNKGVTYKPNLLRCISHDLI